MAGEVSLKLVLVTYCSLGYNRTKTIRSDFMSQSTRELTFIKLIILFLLHKIEIPLSNTQITEFIIGKNYTDYFSLQQYLSEIVAGELVTISKKENTTFYEINERGIETLEYFENRIPDKIKDDIIDFCENAQLIYTGILKVTAEYSKNDQGLHLVHCTLEENDKLLLNMTVNVHSQEQADALCKRWKTEAHTLYEKMLIDLLQ